MNAFQLDACNRVAFQQQIQQHMTGQLSVSKLAEVIFIDLDLPGLRIVFTLEGFMTAEECYSWQKNLGTLCATVIECPKLPLASCSRLSARMYVVF
jgi:hypothetical protein